MEITSAIVECVPVVDCPSAAKSSLDVFMSNAHLKFPDVCTNFYRSQKTSFIERREVVTNHKIHFAYKHFVNSECSKNAISNSLANLWIVLFVEALWLLILDNFWLKLPLTSSVIETFVHLVMACYNSPFLNFTAPFTFLQSNSRKNQGYVNIPIDNPVDLTDHDQSYNADFLPDNTPSIAFMGLYDKVQTLKDIISTSHPTKKILNLYTMKPVFQLLSVLIFLVININYLKDVKDTMRCKLAQHIPIHHEYFLCPYVLASCMSSIVHIYLGVLAVSGFIYFLIIIWTVKLRLKKYEYDCSDQMSSITVGELSDISPVDGDLGFLLHLLHSYNKMYVIRFVHFLSKENKKKIVAHALSKKFPVAGLQTTLDEQKALSFTSLPGIPLGIFDQLICENLLTLNIIKCTLEEDDFENSDKLIGLKSLSIVNCGLKSIPRGILALECLDKLRLNLNLINEINVDIATLKNLSVLSLNDNVLQKIFPGSLTQMPNLNSLDIDDNDDLEMEALHEVLACRSLRSLVCPFHLLKNAASWLNETELEKLQAVTVEK
ncbi:volume-regulated anion channel subunit LRRC8A-like [Xenia sp. Carnegie-2017]|uniref:volume-regulated anion channel subunit LRRC8A-like n=1 Tax=Xenia sp. Carnegie-2017 TaxID=2897299 RepID=UPI001F04CD9D|nr:volume-regulated anion channel subunit LRRC8A-like [Xenia sp. Carnegie-2017]